MAGRGRPDEVVAVKIPVVTGDGRRLELDSDGMPRLIVAEACDEIDPRLWELFADQDEKCMIRLSPLSG